MLWAVHISDGVLPPPWWIGGFVAAAGLLWLAARRLHDEEIPRIALLAAAAFISSSIRVPYGPTSIHLLLTGLLGTVLGVRAALAIACGLFLQALLLGHGGLTSLGVNTVIISLPALAASFLFSALHRVAWVRHAWFRSALVVLSAFIWLWSVVFSVLLVASAWSGSLVDVNVDIPWRVAMEPGLLAACLGAALAVALLERRWETAPEFPLGLLVGELAVLATVALDCGVLLTAGSYWGPPALLFTLFHLPLAVLEGVILGFTLGFLAKVKPEMLFGIHSCNRAPADAGKAQLAPCET